jgi:predicted polyphosphate/ATP-dependent NAD kinase
MSQPRQPLSPEGWQPAGPVRSPVLFVNPRSGGGAAARGGVAERARELGIEVIILDRGRSLTALASAAAASGADALGMAGGDGSLAEVAAVAAASGLPFVCVPAGTGTTSPSTSESTATSRLAQSRRSPTGWSG